MTLNKSCSAIDYLTFKPVLFGSLVNIKCKPSVRYHTLQVSLLSVLPKLVSKEFAGKLSGVTGPDGLYAEFQQKKHAMMAGIKKSSPYNSPHQSPKHRASQSPKHRTLLNRENPHR